ncbi:hypothetical protein GORHZ_241_00130 [Gordonia rhizosphera NBRC 16068]|uniref:Transposase DDE domain-containing protein n=1 Tax=Gordonia rhizosphera NBRC 16068 TaxID=1108045 RepID=K6W3H9_9ACTN|nr:hypothetical protein GORHZ_241_00130 [Gordonia rhizosphera NBRC 16068]
MCAFADHGIDGTDEPLAILLRTGNASANTAADHTAIVEAALEQLPDVVGYRVGKTVLVRTNSAGGTHEFLDYLTRRRPVYSVGFPLTETTAAAIDRIRPEAWTPAYDADGVDRDGAWVDALAGLIDLSGWPDGMRVIVRKVRPHPGAQLRFTDSDGLRLTTFATNTPRGQLADLELRHRRQARCEDRIRTAKDCGLTNLPLHGFDQNRMWSARGVVGLSPRSTPSCREWSGVHKGSFESKLPEVTTHFAGILHEASTTHLSRAIWRET